MSGNFLDTNIIIDYFRGNESVKSLLNNNELRISIFVFGELYYGANNSQSVSKHILQVEELFNQFEVVNSTRETAIYYSKIKSSLKKIGRPIPENDIWIAAMALEYNESLITNDGHFNLIEDLKIINLK